MRSPALMLVLTALAALPAAGGAQQKVDIRRAASPTVSVRLGGPIASVQVIGWEQDSVVITGTLGPGARLDGGPSSASGPATGIKFFVNAPDESPTRGNKLELRVPRNARVWIKSGSADIDVSRVTGGLDLNIVGGSVRVSGKPRELIVESMDGAVAVTGSVSFGRLKTATGDITFDGRAEDVTLSTVSGGIRVTDGQVERGRFESVTGPIVFAADVVRGGDVRFDTHSGPIELRLSPQAGVEIDAESVTGTIENTLTRSRPVIGREGRGMELGTSSGIGGARVSIRSFKGNVRLTAK